MLYKYTTMTTKKCSFVSPKFICDLCDYNCSKQSIFNKHLMTRKHQNKENTTKLQQKIAQNVPYICEPYICECGKEYKYRASLYNHKKKCTYNKEQNIIIPNDNSKDLIFKLVEENAEIRSIMFKQFETMKEQMQQQDKMQNQISELIPKVGNNNTSNTVNKQKFNINIFLNEQCKDALTMEEFINKIEVTLSNLMVTKNKGLCEGVSDIFIENMNKLSLYERPMHCTDMKRETLYIKSESGNDTRWEKDDNNIKIKQAVKKVTHVQRKNLDKWVKEHPDWENNSKEQDEYMLLIKHCTDDLENIKENKVIKKLCNKVHIKGDAID